MKDAAEGRPSAARWLPPLVALGAAAAASLLLVFALPGWHPAGRVAGIVIAAAIGAGTAMQARRRPAVARVGARVSALYLAVLALTAVAGRVWEWLPLHDAQDLRTLLEQHRSVAVWIYFAVCFLQPIALPLPEALTVMTGSAVLGAFAAFVAGFAGTILGIFSMFALARAGGMKLVARLAKPEQLDRYRRYVARNEGLILLALFVIPVLPDEIVCVGAGLSGVSVSRFVLIATLSKLLTSFILAYSVPLGAWLSITPTQMLVLAGTIALAAMAFPRVMRMGRRREAGRRAGGAARNAGRKNGGSEAAGCEAAGCGAGGSGTGGGRETGAEGGGGTGTESGLSDGTPAGEPGSRPGRASGERQKAGPAGRGATADEADAAGPPAGPDPSGPAGRPGAEA